MLSQTSRWHCSHILSDSPNKYAIRGARLSPVVSCSISLDHVQPRGACQFRAIADLSSEAIGAYAISGDSRSTVIPRQGGLHGTLSRFMPSQAIVSRLNVGPDASLQVAMGSPRTFTFRKRYLKLEAQPTRREDRSVGRACLKPIQGEAGGFQVLDSSREQAGDQTCCSEQPLAWYSIDDFEAFVK